MSSKGIKFTSLSHFHIWQCSLCKDTKSWKAHREQRQCSRSNSTWRALQTGHGFQSLQIQMFGGMFVIPALRKLGPAWATQWILFQKKTNTALTENQTLVPILCIKGLTNSFNFGFKGSDGPFWPPWALNSCVPAHTQIQLQITTFRGCGDGSEVKNVCWFSRGSGSMVAHNYLELQVDPTPSASHYGTRHTSST